MINLNELTAKPQGMLSTAPASPGGFAAFAGTVSSIDEAIQRLFPTLCMVANMASPFVPPIAPVAAAMSSFSPAIMRVLIAVDNAAKHVMAGNPGMAGDDILKAIEDHNTPGKTNAVALDETAPPPST